MRIFIAPFFCLAVFVIGVPAHAANASLFTPERNQRIIEQYFKDAPEMVAIAKCESGYRQFFADGSVLRGGIGSAMIGLYQLHETYHRAPAKSMGFDIDTVLGNIGYAKHLYRSEGVAPWLSSAECWQGEVMEAATAVAAPNESGNTLLQASKSSKLTSTLSFGMYHDEIRTLQKILNRTGYRVSKEGPGSRGQETAIFGQLTKSALLRFQCKKDIACDSNDAEYGVVGPKTRRALNRYIDRIDV